MIEAKLPGLWRVGGHGWGVTTTLSGSLDSNVYLLRLDGATVLIDCGTVENEIKTVNGFCRCGHLVTCLSPFDFFQGALPLLRQKFSSEGI